jgi:hypothetical protein
MTQEHPITPPPELVQEWTDAFWNEPGNYVGIDDEALATRAAQWGADQELEACLDQLQRWGIQGVDNLRNARRPKPPSLKEQALQALQEAAYMADDSPPQGICTDQIDTIRRALEALPE